MVLCDSCFFYDRRYDEFCQNYDDVIVEDADERKKHYCPMYNDHIPFAISYENGDCAYYLQKDSAKPQ